MATFIGVVGAVLLAVAALPKEAAAGTMPTFQHIFIVVEENHSYSEIIGSTAAPYINSLTSQNGLATNYFAISHPSLPNYLALTGGSTFGMTTDCAPTSCPVNAANIADRVEASGRTWKAYEESMPSACYLSDSGEYVPKHNPFVYYADIQGNASRCQSHDVPYSQLATDLASDSTTPNYVFITPNLCDDMHDCSVSTGDKWLQSNLPAIFTSPAWTTQTSLMLITWDEDDGNASNHVATLVIGPSVIPGYLSSTVYNHYSLLKTLEQDWSLAALTTNDSGATAMSDFFGASSSSSPSPSPPSSPSPSSSPSPVATATVSGSPTGVTAVAGNHSATVAWAAPTSTGGSPITGYVVLSSTSATTSAGATQTSATMSHLKNGVSYTFTVAALNAVGASSPSALSNAVVPEPPKHRTSAAGAGTSAQSTPSVSSGGGGAATDRSSTQSTGKVIGASSAPGRALASVGVIADNGIRRLQSNPAGSAGAGVVILGTLALAVLSRRNSVPRRRRRQRR